MSFADKHYSASESTFGGKCVKDISFSALDDPKYSDEYKSKRLSKLIGHKVNGKEIYDQTSTSFESSHSLLEIFLDPSLKEPNLMHKR